MSFPAAPASRRGGDASGAPRDLAGDQETTGGTLRANAAPGRDETAAVGKKGAGMYIGLGTVVIILLLVLVVMALRGRA